MNAADRPAVTVVMPFGGSPEEAPAALDRLRRISLGARDRAVFVDNTTDGLNPSPSAGVAVLRAGEERSSYYARNVGAEYGDTEWILFVDADTRPAPGLLDEYFATQVPAGCGMIAGGVVAAPEQEGLIADFARSRGQVSELHHTTSEDWPAGITANLMVRRATFESLGGFHEGVRSGADVEFCWRARRLGWELEHRPAATVEHLHPDRLGPMLRKAARYGAGRLWAGRMHPGAYERPRLAVALMRCAAGALVWTLALRPRRGLYKVLDAAWILADASGYLLGDNRAARPTIEGVVPVSDRPGIVTITDAFPARSETFVYNETRLLRQWGWQVRVESSERPARVERQIARQVPTTYLSDDPPLAKLRALAWLVTRHPIRCVADLTARRRWRREEEVWPLAALAPGGHRLAKARERHVHAHFAAGAALHTLRLARLLGVSYSVSAHAYELFQRPANLTEKFEHARFALAECEFTANHMRAMVAESHRDRIESVATGTSSERFRRRSPYPRGRTVVAIGRLVEKKGFAHLVDAIAGLAQRGDSPPERVIIAGDGPLRAELERRVERHGLERMVELRANVWGPEAVRALLETADVLVVPSVVAADGDRDALPVVVYEALAMEVPVIASDLAGLPEVVRPPWGALVAPGDSEALAEAIGGLLALPGDQRARMGRAGREFVLEHGDMEKGVARVATLLGRAMEARNGPARGSDHQRPVTHRAAGDRLDLD